MPVKIRLTRMGKKKQPSYRVVVVDGRRARDSRYIEQIGRYDPREDPSVIEIDNDKAVDWLRKGAQPTETAKKLLEVSGAWTQFRVAKGDIHTIETSTPAPSEPAVAEVEAEADEEEIEATAPETEAVAVPEAAADEVSAVEPTEEAADDAASDGKEES
ncbi:MAG: 30S ribosomal protein S16 [Acidimicrobiia bacterium]|nr:30S ribosomal protein S16 [Acidimicrobiia bacterium]NNF62672.1 30S ribosomal protein S16 [Acidimicrobiia bacterium]